MQVVESVCTVERLNELLFSNFSSVPVVNMQGGVIGLVPKHFIIALIENHNWYEYSKTARGYKIQDEFKSSVNRRSTILFEELKPKPKDDGGYEPVVVKDDPYDIEQESSNPSSAKSPSSSQRSDGLKVRGNSRINPSNDLDESNRSEPSSPLAKENMTATLSKYTGEGDLSALPLTKRILPWNKFNVDFWSN